MYRSLIFRQIKKKTEQENKISKGIFVKVDSKQAKVVNNSPPKMTYREVIYQAVRDDDGVIQTIDDKTGRIIWQKRLYKVTVDPGLAPGTQRKSIRSIKVNIDDGQIIVFNETGAKYSLNPEIGEFVILEN